MSTIATITTDGVEIGKLELVKANAKSFKCYGCLFLCNTRDTYECSVEDTPLSAVCSGHVWQVAK